MISHDHASQRSRPLARQRASWAISLAFAVLISLTPAILWKDALQSPFLKLDDFVYLAQDRSLRSLYDHMMTPHNAHVVPLFAIQNHLLALLAGNLEAVPRVWGIACYVQLLLAMIVAGILVASETDRTSVGLAAMAGVGGSTVLGPAVLWYSAGQALGSGTLILAMLLALRLWRSRGSWWFLVLAALAAAAAPLYWSAGYVAGLVGLVYLLGERRVQRPLALVPLGASVLTGVLVWTLAGNRIDRAAPGEASAWNAISRIPTGAAHTVQAIPEVLILNNLGLNAATALPQAAALCLLLGLVWRASRMAVVRDRGAWRWLPRPHPLEAVGATLVVTCFVMIYSARGYQSFANLRSLGWYHAIPQLGAVLFATGWIASSLRIPAPAQKESTAKQMFLIAVFAVGLLILQTPRASRVLYEYDGMASKIETREDPRIQAPRSRADLLRRSEDQRSALARLDRLERICKEHRLGRKLLRRVLGRRLIPGMPSYLADLDAFDLLEIPDQDDGDRVPSNQDALRDFDAGETF